MKKILFSIAFVICSCSIYSQNKYRQLEIEPFFRWDTYPKFTYSINPVTSNGVVIKGRSWGTNVAYKFPTKKYYISTGLGYYKHSFNKITQTNSLFGNGTRRAINYIPDGPYTPSLIFVTDKYWYNTLSLNVGLEKDFALSKSTKFLAGFNLVNYFTLSQNYHVTYPAPEGTDYKTSRFRYFGFSTNLHVGLQKEIDKIAIAPILIIPIYDTWKQDKVFPQEENEKSRSKWLKGIGAGISIRYFLIQN